MVCPRESDHLFAESALKAMGDRCRIWSGQGAGKTSSSWLGKVRAIPARPVCPDSAVYIGDKLGQLKTQDLDS